ncbi:MAG: PD40 domain-containing protein [Planctomycetes bacterium]|nr:PD40 domain-containing protein [Planctomycetota bacterium]
MRPALAAAVWCVLSPLAWSDSLDPGDTKVLSFKKSVPAVGGSTRPSVCGSGRRVVFLCDRPNLTNPAGNGNVQVVLLDRETGNYSLASVSTLGTQANQDCYAPRMAADGRHVVFYSAASNLTVGDTLGHHDVFRHDRKTGKALRASLTHDEKEPNAGCIRPSVSENGRYIAFESTASNLTPAGGNGFTQIYVRDMKLGSTELVSAGSGSVLGNGNSTYASISADGKLVAFHSNASNLGAASGTQVWVRNRKADKTELISQGHAGAAPESGSHYPWISGNGRFVAFSSTAGNLTAEDKGPATEDVFVFDRKKEKMRQWVIKAGGEKRDAEVQGISANGRFVLAKSAEVLPFACLVNAMWRMHLIDREQETIELCSVNSQGQQANDTAFAGALCASGKYAVFDSEATNLGNDEDSAQDVFIHRR